jgi:hypothetical protein
MRERVLTITFSRWIQDFKLDGRVKIVKGKKQKKKKIIVEQIISNCVLLLPILKMQWENMQNMFQSIKENTSQNRKIPRFAVAFTRTL